MHRLNGEDDGFFHMDLPNQPMTTLSVATLRLPVDDLGDPVPLTLADLRVHLESRLDQLPSFRWRVLRVPGALHHPVAYRDPEFDIDFHLREVTLPAPGGPDELDALVCELASTRLDRRHPLWQVHLVHGLADGRQALVTRTHHALLDGTAALFTFGRIYTATDAEEVLPVEATVPWEPEALPRPSRLVWDALRDQVRDARRLPGLVRRSWHGFKAVDERQKGSPIEVPAPVSGTEACSLNDAFTARRAWTPVALPLAELKEVKDVSGVSLNDVVLAVVASAFRGYLIARDDLPTKPLTCSVPVGLDAPDAPPRQTTNWFGSLTTSLRTDVEDPWERMLAISEVTREAKVRNDLLGDSLLPEWLDVIPPFVTERGVLGHNRGRQRNRDQADVNVLVSNLRGPRERWHLGPALVEDLYLSGPPSNGVGSNFLVWSYGDRMLFGIRSFADSLDAPAELRARLEDALAELLSLARSRTAAGAAAPA
jgi:WS/DGAT/MGAT family acyltransferase